MNNLEEPNSWWEGDLINLRIATSEIRSWDDLE
jgi:hypothetical protein